MNVFLRAYNNSKKNHLPTCITIGNCAGWFFVATQIPYQFYLISNQNLSLSFVPFFVGTAMNCLFGYFIFRLLLILLSFPFFYFVEAVFGQKEKSYLPGERRDNGG